VTIEWDGKEERREKSVEMENLGEVGQSVGDDAVTGPVTRHTSWARRTISDKPAPTQHRTTHRHLVST
jgi:hypothetical protein